MQDARGRNVDYLRLSVTDRCNLRCIYCMPETGAQRVDHRQVLTPEEIERLASLMTLRAGIRKIRITGGEPLLRKPLLDIVRSIGKLPLRDFALTTNGLLLDGVARQLADAGLKRVNLSVDSLRDDRLAKITRRPLTIDQLETSIRAALDAGLAPVKVNAVVMKGINNDEVPDLIRWGHDIGAVVRFIEHMPTHLSHALYVSRSRILEKARSLGEVRLAEEHDNGTAETFSIDDGAMTFGIIAPFSESMCGRCRRLRLTAVGELVACLGHGPAADLRTMLRSGANDDELVAVVLETIRHKPVNHGQCGRNDMWRIGG